MSVPFETLGPGQVGRLVYQVIGQRGPISNPANIRYLSPGDAQSTHVTASGLPALDFALAAGQIANLGLGLANLGVSAAILSKLKVMDERLQRIESRVNGMDAKLDRLLERVERIDVATAEQNLRSSLRHIMSQAITSDSVDLQILSQVQPDLHRFADSLDPGILGAGLHPGLRLSTDVRDMLSSAYKLLRGARLHVWTQYNQAVGGLPVFVASDAWLEETWTPYAGLIIANVLIARALYESAELLSNGVEANSFFGNDSAKQVIGALFGDDGIPDQLGKQLFDVGPLESLIAITISPGIDLPTLQDGDRDSTEKLERADVTVRQYLAAWSQTDAALLVNLDRECAIQNDVEGWTQIEKTVATLAPAHMSHDSWAKFDPDRVERELAALDTA